MKRPGSGWRGRRRLTTLLTVSGAGLIAATLSLVTVLDVREQRSLILERVERESRLLLRTVNAELGAAIGARDIERLRRVADIVQVHVEIEAVTVFDSTGRILVATGAASQPPGLVVPELAQAIGGPQVPALQRSDRWIDTMGAVTVDGRVVGGVRLGQSVAPLNREIEALVGRHVRQGLLVMGIILVLSFGLARWLVSRIDALMRGLERANVRLHEEIGAREEAQRAAEASAEGLSHTVEELRRTQGRLLQQERLRAEIRTAGDIADDLDNTLQVVLGAAENLVAQRRSLDAEERQASVEMVVQAARDAAAVIARLRQLQSRAAGGRMAAVDLSAIARAAIDDTAPRWRDQRRGVGAEIDLVADIDRPVSTYGEAEELGECVAHLIVNAVEAMPRGGTITVRTGRSGERATLEVRDDGTGMSEEAHRRAVEPFFSTKGAGGSGLGLTLVQGAMTRHGGELDIESRPGEGTLVRLNLPLGAAASISEGESPGSTSEGPLTILLVDDEEAVRRTLRALLERDHHRVSEAGEGAAAVKALRESAFDMVLTDRDMPGMDGVELAALLARLYPWLPVIMITGGMVASVGDEPLPTGVELLLTKPVSLAALRCALREARGGVRGPEPVRSASVD